MLLYIIRHAWAEERDAECWPDDGLRPLTKDGIKRFQRVAKTVAERIMEPKAIATSPLVRCRQTADIFAGHAADDAEIVELDALAPGSQIGPLLDWTRAYPCAAWVGHAPDVDQLASELLGAPAGAIRFAKGSMAAIEFDQEIAAGQGVLQWHVTAKILGL